MKSLVARAFALFLLVTATALHAQVPNLLNYQGRIAVGGVNFNGAGQFKFALVNTNGSTTYWSNDGTSNAGSQPTANIALTVTNGLYSVLLGDTSLPNMTAIPASVWTHPDVRLRVWFSVLPTNASQLLAPDQRLAPNGYLPDGSVSGSKLAAGGTLPALDGSALINLNASNINSGTLSGALFPASVVLLSGAQTLANKTASLNGNTFTFSLSDPNAQSTGLLTYLTGQPVTPQQFGALANGTHDDTAAIQAALDTGRSVFLPEGIYIITDVLAKRSIGQWLRGAGQNRTILRQTTGGKNAINILNPYGDGNAAHEWRGLYDGGGGVYFQEIGDMTIEGTNATAGVGINCNGQGVHIGDYLYLHDLQTFRFGTHFYFDSVAQLRLERITAQNGNSLQNAVGTGIFVPPTSAVPNSFIMEGVSVTGFATGVDVLTSGGKFNFGDVVLCAIGVQINGGQCVIDGGHFESCPLNLNIGSTGPSQVSLHAVNMLVDGSVTTSPIKADHGSVVVGSVSGAAPRHGTALVELVNETDYAQIVNISNNTDNGAALPEPYEYFSDAFGKAVRFPTIDDLKQDNRLPPASAAFRGKIFRIINGMGLGPTRLVLCAELADGTFSWLDMLAQANSSPAASQTLPAADRWNDATPTNNLLYEFLKDHRRAEAKDAEIAELQKHVAELEAKDKEREARLARLESLLPPATAPELAQKAPAAASTCAAASALKTAAINGN